VNPLTRDLDRWFGRGESSITTPPMDGAFRPNDLLDAAAVDFAAPAPDALAATAHGLFVSAGRSLKRVDKPVETPAATFSTEISALTGLPDGGLAVGFIDGRIAFVGGRDDGMTIGAQTGVQCITALAPARDGSLLVANGSATHGPAEWKRDLLEKNFTGSVWRFDLASGARAQIAGNLGYPYGLLDEGDSAVARRGRHHMARLVRAAQSTRRIRPEREPLPSTHDGAD
jgi:hypothetical protein